jgi:hypothetical protein
LASLISSSAFADDEWSFLPSSTIFKPLIGDPREPSTAIIAYLDRSRYEGQIGSTAELLRYDPGDRTQWGWGCFGSGYILLDQNGATFPMLDGDWYFGTYFSEKSGQFSIRLEGLHSSSHLGDSLQGIQVPLYYLPTAVPYSRENVNVTFSIEPSETCRLYTGMGAWDSTAADPFFATFGGEFYSSDWSIVGISMRAYSTLWVQWKGDVGVWDKEIQLGLQWRTDNGSGRALRTALVFYSGNSQFIQFYDQFDEHLALATYFDF